MIHIHAYIVKYISGPHFDIKTVFAGMEFHYKDNTVVRLSYFYNANPCIGKPASIWFLSISNFKITWLIKSLKFQTNS